MKTLASEMKLPAEFTLPRPVAGELRGLMNRYFCNLLGRRPKTQHLLTAGPTASTPPANDK